MISIASDFFPIATATKLAVPAEMFRVAAKRAFCFETFSRNGLQQRNQLEWVISREGIQEIR